MCGQESWPTLAWHAEYMSQEKGVQLRPFLRRTVVKNLRTIPGISSSKLVFSGCVSRGHQERCNSVVLIWVGMVLYCLSLSRGERKEIHEHISKSLSLKKRFFFQIVWNLRLTIYTCSKNSVDSFCQTQDELWHHREIWPQRSVWRQQFWASKPDGGKRSPHFWESPLALEELGTVR